MEEILGAEKQQRLVLRSSDEKGDDLGRKIGKLPPFTRS